MTSSDMLLRRTYWPGDHSCSDPMVVLLGCSFKESPGKHSISQGQQEGPPWEATLLSWCRWLWSGPLSLHSQETQITASQILGAQGSHPLMPCLWGKAKPPSPPPGGIALQMLQSQPLAPFLVSCGPEHWNNGLGGRRWPSSGGGCGCACYLCQSSVQIRLC